MSKRSWGACVTQLFSALGQCALAVLIYFVRNWRLAQLITAASLAVLVVYIWYVFLWHPFVSIVKHRLLEVLFLNRFIPESARWLLSRGRTEEAKKLIIKAAAINKRPVPDDLLEKVRMFLHFYRDTSQHIICDTYHYD